MDPEEIKTLIEDGLPGSTARVMSDDNTHFQAIVVSEAFRERKRLARHQLVYGCLGERMGREIHALSIRAYTPQEWQRRQAG